MEEYTLELVFKPEPDNTTFGKLIDFKGKSSDNGIYIYDNGANLYISYVPGGYVGQTELKVNDYNQLIITRNKNTKNVFVFLNKIKQFEFTDTVGNVVLNDNIWLFVDDDITAVENIGNRVSKIKLFAEYYTQQEIINLPIFHGKISGCSPEDPWTRPTTTTPAPQSYCSINSIEDIPSSLFLSIDCEYDEITTSIPTTTVSPSTTTTTTISPTTTTTTTISPLCLPEIPQNIAIECVNPGDTSSSVLASISWEYPTYLCNIPNWMTVYVIEAMYNAEDPGSNWVEKDSFFASLYSGPNLGTIPRVSRTFQISKALGDHRFRVTAALIQVGTLWDHNTSRSVITSTINWNNCALLATNTPTPTPTITPTKTLTPTPTQAPAPTNTSTLTSTPTITKTSTSTLINPALTQTPTSTFTNTPTLTPTGTSTPTLTPTLTPTVTNTTTSNNPTNTPTLTRTSSNTPTLTRTSTNTPTLTRTSTNTPTLTRTSTNTPTLTRTSTNTPTLTPTLTRTQTPSAANPSLKVLWVSFV